MKPRLAVPLLLALLALTFLASLAFGELRLSFGQVLGALNVATEAGLKGHAPTPSEKLLVWNIEVLVASGDERIRGRLAEIPHYRALPAFKAGRVVIIPGPMMSSVSHHRIAAYEALARALHPERFR